MVNVLFIESKSKKEYPELTKQDLAKLPKKIFLAYSIQFKDNANKIKKQLEQNKIKVSNFQQVLGC